MKFLVISLAGIGDTLFATPLIHELRVNFPDARIDALVMWAGSRDALEGNPHVNRVFQKNLIKAPKGEVFRLLRELRRERYDVSLNAHPQSRSEYRWVARFIAARERLSHSYENHSVVDRWLVTRVIPQDYHLHCIENNLAFLPLLGAARKLPSHGYELYLSPAETQWAGEYQSTHGLAGKAILGVHIGSGGTKNLPLRRWPGESYAELIRQLHRALPEVEVLVFGGPEEERENARLLAAVAGTRARAVVTKSLRQAAALIGRCHAFLSVDTALMHLAAAMRVPRQIIIETPTWNKPIEPFNQAFTLVRNPAVAGRNLDYYRYDGRGIRGSPEAIIASMNSVAVGDVLQAVEAALRTHPSASPVCGS